MIGGLLLQLALGLVVLKTETGRAAFDGIGNLVIYGAAAFAIAVGKN